MKPSRDIFWCFFVIISAVVLAMSYSCFQMYSLKRNPQSVCPDQTQETIDQYNLELHPAIKDICKKEVIYSYREVSVRKKRADEN